MKRALRCHLDERHSRGKQGMAPLYMAMTWRLSSGLTLMLSRGGCERLALRLH